MLDQGAGAGTVLRQIVADELGVNWQSIALETLDTAGAPVDTGVGAKPGNENLWQRLLRSSD